MGQSLTTALMHVSGKSVLMICSSQMFFPIPIPPDLSRSIGNYNIPMLHFGPYVIFQPCVCQILARCTLFLATYHFLALWPCPQMNTLHPLPPHPGIDSNRSSVLSRTMAHISINLVLINFIPNPVRKPSLPESLTPAVLSDDIK